MAKHWDSFLSYCISAVRMRIRMFTYSTICVQLWALARWAQVIRWWNLANSYFVLITLPQIMQSISISHAVPLMFSPHTCNHVFTHWVIGGWSRPNHAYPQRWPCLSYPSEQRKLLILSRYPFRDHPIFVFKTSQLTSLSRLVYPCDWRCVGPQIWGGWD